jgi:hypothetical protein
MYIKSLFLGAIMARLDSALPVSLKAHGVDNRIKTTHLSGGRFTECVYGPEVARANRSKYMPHNGVQKAERETRRFETPADRRARALASMNSKGLPYHWEREFFPDGSIRFHMLAHGQTLAKPTAWF